MARPVRGWKPFGFEDTLWKAADNNRAATVWSENAPLLAYVTSAHLNIPVMEFGTLQARELDDLVLAFGSSSAPSESAEA
jgi:hypothetical protein